jgi:type IV secretory pathway VirB2 component (pilin)
MIFNSEFVCTVLFQVVLVFSFLSIFYFTYAKNKEKDTVINNVNFLLNSFTSNSPLKIPQNVKDQIKQNASSSPTPESLKADRETEANNKSIFKKTMKTLAKTLMVVLIIIMTCKYMEGKNSFFVEIHMKKLLIQSVIILLFVALTEFLFLNYLGSKFISINPNKLKAVVLQNVYNYA